MAAPKVELGWDNTDLQAGAAKAQGILAGFATRAKSTLGRAMSADVVGGFGQLTAAIGSLAGIKSVIDGFDRLNDLSIQLDTSVESLQRLGGVAKLSGTDLETLVKGVSKLTLALSQAEESDKVAGALQKLGISASQLRAMSVEDQIFALSDAFIAARDRGEGFTEVFDLMGRKGAELIPVLMAGRDALQELADVPVLNDEQVKRLAEFNDRLDKGALIAKSWAAELALGAADVAAVFALAMTPGQFEGSFSERMEQASRAMAETKIAAEEAAQAQEEQRQKARETAEWARKVDEAQKAAAKAAEDAAKENERWAARMADLKTQLDAARESNLKINLQPTEQLELAKGKVSDLDAKLKAGRDAAYMSGGANDDLEKVAKLELERERALSEVLALEKQISEEEERQLQTQQEKKATQDTAKTDLATSLEILQKRATGRNKEADAIERQARIAAEAKRIADETGLSEEQALRIARTKADLEDKIAKRGDSTKGGRKRIIGYKSPDNFPSFTGLAYFDALQERDARGGYKYDAFNRAGDTRSARGTPRKSAYERAGEILRARAAANGNKEGGAGTVRLTEGNQILQLLTEIREGIGDFASV